MTVIGRQALPEVREWSGDPFVGPGVVGRPSRRSGSGWEALLEFRVWSGGFPGSLGVDGSPSRRFGRV